MNLEQQVVSLDIAKLLKELGVKQESYFVWIIPKNGGSPVVVPDMNGTGDRKETENYNYLAAFTVAELGEMLPSYFVLEKLRTRWRCYCGGVFTTPKMFDEAKDQYASNQADARGKMLIYLLENKLITL